jgi:Ca-activated chloride channel family protein
MSEQVPLSYGLLIDASASIHSQLEDVVRTTIKIVDSNRPTDNAFVIRFISSEKIETVQALTADKQALKTALDSMYIEGGQSAILDAVYLSAEYLAQNTDGTLRRRALIVATDGDERLSYYNAQQVVQILTSTDIQVYIVAFTKDLKKDKHEKAIRLVSVLASNAGGRVYFPSSAADLDRIANEIINDIRTQYLIGYIPSSGASKAFQKVEVSIADNQNQDKRVAITSVGYSTSAKVLKEQK